MRGLSNRLDRLEAHHGPDALGSAMSDEELVAAFERITGAMAALELEPPCGWNGPLSDLIRWLERETAH